MFFTTFLREKFWHIAFLLAVAYFLLLIRSDIIQNRGLDDERSLSRHIELERAKQEDLKVKMRSLGKSSYIEELAREKLGLVDRGETAYKVIIK